jgi:hypothetical protein
MPFGGEVSSRTTEMGACDVSANSPIQRHTLSLLLPSPSSATGINITDGPGIAMLLRIPTDEYYSTRMTSEHRVGIHR